MADQPNLFEEQAKQETPAVTEQPVADVNTDLTNLLAGIKNESGQQKYDSLPKALEGLQHAQQYIPQLKAELSQRDQELATLREELAKRQAVEDVVTRLTAKQEENKEQGTPPASSGLTEEAVLKLVQQMLGQQKAQDQATQNQAQVQQVLSQKFGDKAREVIETKARELGTTPSELGQLASKNPAMVLALFNSTATPSVKPTTGSQHLPSTYKPEVPKLERPQKSLLMGSTSKEQKEFMQKVKEEVYAKLGVQSQ